jgi:hypothetical protein
MANELAKRTNFVGGLVENNPLLASDTTLTSAALAAAPVVDSTSHCTIILDPDGVAGAPEIAWITVHTSGATTATIQRAAESTAARDHLRDTPWIHAPTAADYSNASANDRAFIKGANPNALDDEFNTGVLDSSWVRVDAPSSAHLTWTVAGDCLSAYHTGTDSAAQYHALVKPMGASFAIGNTIDTCISYCGPIQASPMCGVILTDGATNGSGIQIQGATWQQGTTTNPATGIRRSTGYNAETNNAGNITMGNGRYRVHLRLTWVAANSFRAWTSDNGVSWLPIVAATAYTLTPTYVGLFLTSWGSTSDFIISYEYFRVN